MAHEILKCLVLFILLSIFCRWAFLLSGMVFAFLSIFLVLPIVRQLMEFIDFILISRILVIPKLIAWIIGAAGITLGYFIYCFIFGTPNTPIEYYICSTISLGYLTLCTHKILFSHSEFDTKVADAQMRNNPLASMLGGSRFTDYYKHNAANTLRSYFMDTAVITLLSFASAFAFFCFSTSHIGLMEFNGRQPPDLLNSILSVANIMNFGTAGTKVFRGPFWELASFGFTVIVFLWAAIIIQIANNSLAQELSELKLADADTPRQSPEEPPPQTKNSAENSTNLNPDGASDNDIPNPAVTAENSPGREPPGDKGDALDVTLGE